MKTKKRYLWGGILNKERFKRLEEENANILKNLSLEKSIRLTEEFLSSTLFDEFQTTFIYDEPLCFKLGLKMRKKNVRNRI